MMRTLFCKLLTDTFAEHVLGATEACAQYCGHADASDGALLVRRTADRLQLLRVLLRRGHDVSTSRCLHRLHMN